MTIVTRRSRLATIGKPAPQAGLMLYVAAKDPWNDWAALAFAEKDVDDARAERVAPDKPNEDLLVINPEQRLPALVDRELLLLGARVIVEYLDERYPHPRLLPQDPAGRAKVRMVLEQFATELFPVLQEALTTRNAKTKAPLAKQVANSGRWFNGKGYFLGVDYTQADLAWAVWLHGVQALGLPLPDTTARYRDKLAARPVIASYFKSA